MLIENIATANYFANSAFGKQKEEKSGNGVISVKKNAFGHDDSYVSSKRVGQIEASDDIKAKNLSEVKTRIVSGFYNSPAVNDDLTDVFTEIFKKTFS